jgi:hypothetical protein
MGVRRWFLVAVALSLMLTCFFPWLIIQSPHIVISGMNAKGTAYGKPGVLSLFFTGIVFLLSFVPRVWAHRINLVCSAINTGWALRNFILLSACQGGECPQRQPAFYLYLVSSVLLLIAVLVQHVKLPATAPQ